MKAELAIVNQRGLHARAAAKFVHLASTYESRVTVSYDGNEADGKSILSLMVLGAAVGARILVSTDGPDEETALDGLRGLVESGFDE